MHTHFCLVYVSRFEKLETVCHPIFENEKWDIEWGSKHVKDGYMTYLCPTFLHVGEWLAECKRANLSLRFKDCRDWTVLICDKMKPFAEKEGTERVQGHIYTYKMEYNNKNTIIRGIEKDSCICI